MAFYLVYVIAIILAATIVPTLSYVRTVRRCRRG
jgi:hypothetical protein